MKRLICLVVDHRWRTYNGMILSGVNAYVGSLAGTGLTCTRCGATR